MQPKKKIRHQNRGNGIINDYVNDIVELVDYDVNRAFENNKTKEKNTNNKH